MKQIAVGDLGEFWYGDYKEPFVQLEGAVPGYPQGVVLKADDGKLLCAYCGKTYDQLGSHAFQRHGMLASEYKRETGLLQKSALVSERVRFQRIATGVRLQSSSSVRHWPKGVRHRTSTGAASGQRSAEQLNKTGRCYAQVLAVARQLGATKAGVTHNGLARHGIGRLTYERYFGSLENLRSIVGNSATHNGVAYTERELVEPLKRLAAELGRTPAWSDIKRHGLPSWSAYKTRFGSYAKACEAAGFDPNVPNSWAADFDQRVMIAYATSGLVEATAKAVGATVHTVIKSLHRYGFPFSYGSRWNLAERKAWGADMARRLAGWPETARASAWPGESVA